MVSGRWGAMPAWPSPPGAGADLQDDLILPLPSPFCSVSTLAPRILHLEALPPLLRVFWNLVHFLVLSSPLTPVTPCCSFCLLCTPLTSPKGQGLKAYSIDLGGQGPKVYSLPLRLCQTLDCGGREGGTRVRPKVGGAQILGLGSHRPGLDSDCLSWCWSRPSLTQSHIQMQIPGPRSGLIELWLEPKGQWF